ncbi:MAG: flippase-like domain-containing protein [Candidatus Rokuibacteriota bacterium]
MRLVRGALLLLGAALLVALVVHDDPAAILASLATVGWRFAILVVFPMVLVTWFDTLGWRYAFLDDRVPLRALLTSRLAGEAFNLTTPTAALGGEAVKAWLIRAHAPIHASVASVIVAKTTITLAHGLFLLVGVVAAWAIRLPPSPLLQTMQWLLVLEALALAGFVVVQTRGLVGRMGRGLDRVGLGALIGQAALGGIDAGLREFWLRAPRRVALSILYHLVAWLLGVVEAWLILAFLGVDVSLGTATVIEAFGAAIRFATFLIPGSLGAMEGGYAAIFAALGLGSTTGLTFSLVRRVREAVWIALGLIAFALTRPPAPA